MNRQIKFRAKPKDAAKYGEWVYGYYMREIWDFIFKSPVRIEVLPDTAGQFTGLYDATKWEDLPEEERNRWTIDGNMPSAWEGREIYEGDIIKATHPNHTEIFIGDVFWDCDWAAFCLSVSNCEIRVSDFDEYRVIGNIHDNKLEDYENL
jgi:hypothetical protein